MAAKKPTRGKSGKPPVGKKKRRRKKMRLTLKSKAIKKTDSYTDQIGWETSGHVLTGESKVNDTPTDIKHQCSLCGTVMIIPKPKRAKYTVTCPHCEHEDKFD
ncbi:MAG: hypothetical protein H8E32_06945 [Nitrospinae bacterium]|nr:hypothetical protein [Nitrospinota bacterium]